MKILYNKDKWLDIYSLPKYESIRQKILTTFNGLTFIEDGHKYFLNGKEMECVSNVAHLFQKHIDSVKLAQETFVRNHNKPESKYFLMSVEDILESWQKISSDACSHGTETHEFGESAFYYMTGQYDKILPAFKDRLTDDGGFKAIHPKEESIVNFYEEIPRCIVPILAETKVFVEYDKAGYAGTFDILFFYDAELDNKPSDKSGLMVLDWKGLDVNTPIFTKNQGWKTMGTIQVNDIVYDKNGCETKVLHTSKVHHKKCYKITFNNNTEIIADYEHRWEITYGGHNSNKYDVLTTEELYNYCQEIKDKRRTGNIPCLEVTQPLINNNISNYSLDAYMFGVWLSDRSPLSTYGVITTPYTEVFRELNNRGFSVRVDASVNKVFKYSRVIHGWRKDMIDAGLMKKQYLPQEVLLSDYNYKKTVLAGIMDSNGEYNSNKKEFSYITINQEQSNLVLQLISSMGIKAQVNQKTDRNTKKAYYEITFNCNFNPFYAREVNVDIKEKNSNNLIIIKNVEECDTVPTRCIEVDSPTHTFLYGNQFMVTHNTNKDLYKNFASQKLLPPFDGLLDMPLSVYKLQLSLYENALTKIGMKVVGRRILWLKPDCSYEKIPLESYRERIDNELKKLYN